MRCQESSQKAPKCSCCNQCIRIQNDKCQKNNLAPERISHQTTNESYFKNFAIPDDLYYCKENLNRVKSYNERVLKILDDLKQRAFKIFENSEFALPSEYEDEDDELDKQQQQILHKKIQSPHLEQHHSQKHQSCLQQHQHSQNHQSCLQEQQHSQQHQSCLQQQQHSQQPNLQQEQKSPQHQSYLQKKQHSQQHQSCLQKQEHSQQHQSHLQKQQNSQQHQSYLQQEQQNLQRQEQCTPNSHSKGKLQVAAPCDRIQNLGYLPQSNFLKKMKRRGEVDSNTIKPAQLIEVDSNTPSPLNQCGCINYVPDGFRYRTQIMCPCCRCNPLSYTAQNMPCGRLQIRERSGPCSDVSSIHDPCTCFRTWRPCAGHFPAYQYDILEREDEICPGEAYIQEYFTDRCDECKDKTPSKKKGKSGHVSRLDKRRRRSGRRKSKPNEKDCLPSDIDFSPSLKMPHPNSCERCWRYASPSRSPVNRPSQRFDPNYRRSHSEVNINSESILKSSDRYSSTKCVEFDPDAKVHEEMSSVNRSLTRTKSADNVKKSSFVRTDSPHPSKRTPRAKDDAEVSRIKTVESDLVSMQKPKSKYPRSCIRSTERSKEILRNDRQNPMPCSPSMFDKKSQISNSKKSTSNRLSSLESCKENLRTKPRPSSACQMQTSEDCFDKPRAQSFDRNCLKENFCIPPERMKKCCCIKPRTRTMNMNVMCDQPLFYQGERDCFPGVRGPFGISNNQDNPMGFNKLCLCQDRTQGFFDIRPCVCSFKDLPESKLRESLTHSCCQKGPVTLWDRKVVSKDDDENDREGNGGKIRNRNRKDEESNPRKFCVFYMNKSEENDNDEVQVLIEELTEGKNAKNSKTESLKSKMKKMQELRSDSMALRFQKGISEKCRRR